MRILMILASSSALCGLGLTPGTSLSSQVDRVGPVSCRAGFSFGLDPSWTQNREPAPRPGLGRLTYSPGHGHSLNPITLVYRPRFVGPFTATVFYEAYLAFVFVG
jgi:hypothetical protein